MKTTETNCFNKELSLATACVWPAQLNHDISLTQPPSSFYNPATILFFSIHLFSSYKQRNRVVSFTIFMSDTSRLKEGYKKLKEIVNKIINPKKEKVILQPVPVQRPYRYK